MPDNALGGMVCTIQIYADILKRTKENDVMCFEAQGPQNKCTYSIDERDLNNHEISQIHNWVSSAYSELPPQTRPLKRHAGIGPHPENYLIVPIRFR